MNVQYVVVFQFDATVLVNVTALRESSSAVEKVQH